MKKQKRNKKLKKKPIRSNRKKKRVNKKSPVKSYNCGDMIIRTDVPELIKELDEKLSRGMTFKELYELQDKYPVPIIVGFGMKDNWNVYKDELSELRNVEVN